ncbi:MAG TPA: hypothetical protein VFQ53_26365 [Kofleriaceae bacterium]|nr:hypothetical protein [Kofleriaceae bacterium]
MLELRIAHEPFSWDGAQQEILDGPAFAGLTRAEKKALAITSTFETGHAGGFYGLSGNFDGQGLSFGLVNWNIGSGSLQPLLKEFLVRFPDRWQACFGAEAERFRQLLALAGKDATKQQLAFVIAQMNKRVPRKRDGKLVWAVAEPWASHFRKLADDREFQAIQIRHAGDLLARAKFFCDHFSFTTERAFCMMFDTVASHGKWWLQVKSERGEARRRLLDTKLGLLRMRYFGSIPEREKLRAIAETLAETSRPRWQKNVLERKLWFLTGEHRRANELRELLPTDDPYTTSATALPAAPAPRAPTAPTAGYDPTIDIALITAYAKGARNHEDLADAAFFQRHPERKQRPIGASEADAKAEWKRLRARGAELFPAAPARELDLEADVALTDASVEPVVRTLVAGGMRDPNKLASEAFYRLNPSRGRAPIDARREPDAVATWKRLRAGVVARVLATVATPARILKTESSERGTMLYLELALDPRIPRMTAVFIPHGYRASASVDVLLYLHGKGGPQPIERYLKAKVPLHERVAESRKNVILVAPTLGLQSESGSLRTPGGLDRYLASVLGALASHATWSGRRPLLRHLIVAAHSGGGAPMARVAAARDVAARAHLRECWGFDCFYNRGDMDTWLAWAKQYPDRTLYGYWNDSSTKVNVQRLIGSGLPNIRIARVKRPGHWTALEDFPTERLDRASFLDDR